MNCRLSVFALLVLAVLPAAAWSDASSKSAAVVGSNEILAKRTVIDKPPVERLNAAYADAVPADAGDFFSLSATERTELRRQIERAADELYGGSRPARRAANGSR